MSTITLRKSPLFRFIAFVVLAAFVALLPAQPTYAQLAFLPVAGTMVTMTPKFDPMVVKGIRLYPDNPFKFDFIVDTGDMSLSKDQIKEQGQKLISYFLASLTTPEKEMWVNLSPFEKNRIIPTSFGQTEMGKVVLTQDYMLKQIMATALYPERQLGKEFWKKVYAEASQKFGTTDVPVNTFNKVWILPDQAVVYENAQMNAVFVVNSTMKVMLEQDYLAANKNKAMEQYGLSSSVIARSASDAAISSMSSKIIKEIVIPALEKEVNTGKNFAGLRQVYGALILASWYKKNLKDNVLSKGYVNRNKTMGVNVADKNITQEIYHQYLRAYRKGVYNYIKEEIDPATEQVIPRKYFSGGWTAEYMKVMDVVTTSPAAQQFGRDMAALSDKNRLREIGAGANFVGAAVPGSQRNKVSQRKSPGAKKDKAPIPTTQSEQNEAAILAGIHAKTAALQQSRPYVIKGAQANVVQTQNIKPKDFMRDQAWYYQYVEGNTPVEAEKKADIDALLKYGVDVRILEYMSEASQNTGAIHLNSRLQEAYTQDIFDFITTAFGHLANDQRDRLLNILHDTYAEMARLIQAQGRTIPVSLSAQLVDALVAASDKRAELATIAVDRIKAEISKLEDRNEVLSASLAEASQRNINHIIMLIADFSSEYSHNKQFLDRLVQQAEALKAERTALLEHSTGVLDYPGGILDRNLAQELGYDLGSFDKLQAVNDQIKALEAQIENFDAQARPLSVKGKTKKPVTTSGQKQNIFYPPQGTMQFLKGDVNNNLDQVRGLINGIASAAHADLPRIASVQSGLQWLNQTYLPFLLLGTDSNVIGRVHSEIRKLIDELGIKDLLEKIDIKNRESPAALAELQRIALTNDGMLVKRAIVESVFPSQIPHRVVFERAGEKKNKRQGRPANRQGEEQLAGYNSEIEAMEQKVVGLYDQARELRAQMSQNTTNPLDLDSRLMAIHRNITGTDNFIASVRQEASQIEDLEGEIANVVAQITALDQQAPPTEIRGLEEDITHLNRRIAIDEENLAASGKSVSAVTLHLKDLLDALKKDRDALVTQLQAVSSGHQENIAAQRRELEATRAHLEALRSNINDLDNREQVKARAQSEMERPLQEMNEQIATLRKMESDDREILRALRAIDLKDGNAAAAAVVAILGRDGSGGVIVDGIQEANEEIRSNNEDIALSQGIRNILESHDPLLQGNKQQIAQQLASAATVLEEARAEVALAQQVRAEIDAQLMKKHEELQPLEPKAAEDFLGQQENTANIPKLQAVLGDMFNLRDQQSLADQWLKESLDNQRAAVRRLAEDEARYGVPVSSLAAVFVPQTVAPKPMVMTMLSQMGKIAIPEIKEPVAPGSVVLVVPATVAASAQQEIDIESKLILKAEERLTEYGNFISAAYWHIQSVKNEKSPDWLPIAEQRYDELNEGAYDTLREHFVRFQGAYEELMNARTQKDAGRIKAAQRAYDVLFSQFNRLAEAVDLKKSELNHFFEQSGVPMPSMVAQQATAAPIAVAPQQVSSVNQSEYIAEAEKIWVAALDVLNSAEQRIQGRSRQVQEQAAPLYQQLYNAYWALATNTVQLRTAQGDVYNNLVAPRSALIADFNEKARILDDLLAQPEGNNPVALIPTAPIVGWNNGTATPTMTAQARDRIVSEITVALRAHQNVIGEVILLGNAQLKSVLSRDEGPVKKFRQTIEIEHIRIVRALTALEDGTITDGQLIALSEGIEAIQQRTRELQGLLDRARGNSGNGPGIAPAPNRLGQFILNANRTPPPGAWAIFQSRLKRMPKIWVGVLVAALGTVAASIPLITTQNTQTPIGQDVAAYRDVMTNGTPQNAPVTPSSSSASTASATGAQQTTAAAVTAIQASEPNVPVVEPEPGPYKVAVPLEEGTSVPAVSTEPGPSAQPAPAQLAASSRPVRRPAPATPAKRRWSLASSRVTNFVAGSEIPRFMAEQPSGKTFNLQVVTDALPGGGVAVSFSDVTHTLGVPQDSVSYYAQNSRVTSEDGKVIFNFPVTPAEVARMKPRLPNNVRLALPPGTSFKPMSMEVHTFGSPGSTEIVHGDGIRPYLQGQSGMVKMGYDLRGLTASQIETVQALFPGAPIKPGDQLLVALRSPAQIKAMLSTIALARLYIITNSSSQDFITASLSAETVTNNPFYNFLARIVRLFDSLFDFLRINPHNVVVEPYSSQTAAHPATAAEAGQAAGVAATVALENYKFKVNRLMDDYHKGKLRTAYEEAQALITEGNDLRPKSPQFDEDYFREIRRVQGVEEALRIRADLNQLKDKALTARHLGGIDLEKVNVNSRGSGVRTAFSDPRILAMLLKSHGLKPVIYFIRPMTLPVMNMLLGLNTAPAANDNTPPPAKEADSKPVYQQAAFIDPRTMAA